MRQAFTAVVATATTLVLVLAATESGRGQASLTALPRVAAAPPDNPTDSRRVALGQLLFWDPILSGNKDVSCATCHHPQFGYAENLDVSIGVNGVGLGEHRWFALPNSIPFVKRNSQTILNVAFNGIDQAGRYDPSEAPMFWDVRVLGLEAQALEPIKSFEEMRGGAYPEDKALEHVVARLQANAEYRSFFSAAFGGGPAVTATNLGKALAAFQRSLVASNSPFDRYMRGDASALTSSQARGMQRFERIGCVNCHSGPMFSDFKPHVLGVPDSRKLPASDSGVKETYAFRTASLRNLVYTAPYMHSGVFQTLDDVLDFYDNVTSRRPRGLRNQHVTPDQLDPLLRRLRDVDRQSDDVIAFLEALSDDSFDKSIPKRLPSGLHPGGAIQ